MCALVIQRNGNIKHYIEPCCKDPCYKDPCSKGPCCKESCCDNKKKIVCNIKIKENKEINLFDLFDML
jgi:hypothetical protein